MKTAGILLVLAGSIWITAADICSRRKTLALLQELAAALDEMEAYVRWKRETLPNVIARQTERPLCGSYFSAVLDGLNNDGLTMENSWKQAFAQVQPREAGECLCRVELCGDEEHLMGNLHLASETLRQLRQEWKEKQREEEKLHLAMVFSGAGMLIILLI